MISNAIVYLININKDDHLINRKKFNMEVVLNFKLNTDIKVPITSIDRDKFLDDLIKYIRQEKCFFKETL